MCCCCDCGSSCRDERNESMCGCGHTRRFLTKQEKVVNLKNYAEDLKNELAAVEEQIGELES